MVDSAELKMRFEAMCAYLGLDGEETLQLDLPVACLILLCTLSEKMHGMELDMNIGMDFADT